MPGIRKSICVICRVEFSFYHRSGPHLKTCSDECKREQKNVVNRRAVDAVSRRNMRICEVCSKPFPVKQGSTGRYCSKSCVHSGRSAEVRALFTTECPMCGTSFFAKYMKPGNRKKYCSDVCARKGTSEYQRSITKYPSAEARKRANWAVRDRRLRGEGYERVDPFVVFDAYGWKCHICGIDTPVELRGTLAPNAPELDHLIPLAIGGKHQLQNLGLACKRCNIQKQDKTKMQSVLALWDNIASGRF